MNEALQVCRLKDHVFEHSMNSRHFAAVAITAGLLAFASQTVVAADGPLAQFAGSWSGNGKITVQNGSSERIRCRSSNNAGGNGMSMSLRCASDSYKFELQSSVTHKAGAISGTWSEVTRGAVGTISGTSSGSQINLRASSPVFSAALALVTRSNQQSISMQSPGSEIAAVSINLNRGSK